MSASAKKLKGVEADTQMLLHEHMHTDMHHRDKKKNTQVKWEKCCRKSSAKVEMEQKLERG